jgi:imidazolonepropionase
VEVKTGCGADEPAQTKLLRVIDALNDDPLHLVPSLLVHMPQESFSRDSESHSRAALEALLPKVRRRRLGRFADLLWPESGCGQDFSHWYLALARRLGLPAKVHAEGQKTSGAISAAITHLASSIDHLEHATESEAAELAGSSTMATLLPCTSLGNGGRVPPARAMIDAGVAIALATNFDPKHTQILNMQTVIGLACLHLKMTVAEAISASTINAAHALGYAERAGSLEPGKSADVVILNIPDCRDLAQHLGVNLVHMTLKRGAIIYQEGEVAPRDLPRLKPVPVSR